MRIVHTRKRVFTADYAFEHKMTLLTWILSILKWKEYGNTVVLYTDKITLDKIKEFEFDNLYDEINDILLEDEQVIKGLDFYCFWAIPKLLAYRYESIDLDNDVVIADTDVVPMNDLSRLWTNSDVAVWSNKEFVEVRSVYPRLRDLSLPNGYKIPNWFCGKAKPLNTGIIHIKSKDIIDFYTGEAIKMATDNHNDKHNTNVQIMCNVEQRLLGEIVKHKNLTYSVVQPINQGLFNRNGFHIHGYKSDFNNEKSLPYNVKLLNMIKEKDYWTYNKLINNEFFKEEKEAIENSNEYIIKEFEIYEE